MGAVLSTRARRSRVGTRGSPALDRTSGGADATGTFQFILRLVSRRSGRKKGGPLNEYPDAGVQIAGH